MNTRHRIPTIFNLSMVDVLCCALGCVILLWLVNLREVKERAAAISRSSATLQETREILREKTDEANATRLRLAAVVQDRDDARTELGRIRTRLAELDGALADLRGQKSAAEESLARKTKEQQEMARNVSAARLRGEQLADLLQEKDALARAAVKNVDDLSARLRDADTRVRSLKTQADTLPLLREKLSGAEARLRALEKDLRARQQDLTEADRRLAALQGDKKTLGDQAARARSSLENRFAGITLTGRRVVFLVDMSGSMDLVDDKTPAADKWLGVRDTLAKVMRSLPDLEKYQVILFSDKVAFPLGRDGQWLDYNAPSSDRAFQALAASKPKGGTNLYTAFEAAFRFRAAGLDTIYLLSDGLPNQGAGLEASSHLKDFERSALLAKHLRKTLHGDWNRPLADRPRVRINAIGFFYESPDVGAFLWALAREHDGSFVGMSKP